MELSRASGILLHLTALPGPCGIGDLGPEAYRFVDFLADTGQNFWQTLPLGPTGYGNAPCMCFSAFSGNGLLISLEALVQEGLLTPAEVGQMPAWLSHRVDYSAVIHDTMPLLGQSLQRFTTRLAPHSPEDWHAFCERHAFWLADCALCTALKEGHGGRPWPPWEALRRYCHARGVRIIGDMPIYVAHDSAEVWAHRELFYLDAQGSPLVVAGVPPDYFSATGQRWGNPLYRWEVMAQTYYQWWVDRFRLHCALTDMLRLDHLRGFEAYWESPASDPLTVNGRWLTGPGAALFDAVCHAPGELPMIAEDSGMMTFEVDALRDHLGLPGMRIVQMAFGDDPKAPTYRPHNDHHHCVVYTATHDHNTTVGWFTTPPRVQTTQSQAEVERERVQALCYLGTDGSAIHRDMIRLASGSVASLAIVPLQDVLGLGTAARLNLPGTSRGNWEWRVTADLLTPPLRTWLADLIRIYERYPA